MDWLLAILTFLGTAVHAAPPARAAAAAPPPAGRAKDPLGGTVLDWVRQLSDDHWRAREEATENLIELGVRALPFLPRARDVSDAEASCRLEFVRRRIDDQRRLSRVVILGEVARDRINAMEENSIVFTMRSSCEDSLTIRAFEVEVYGPDGTELAPLAHRRTASPIGSPRCVRCLVEASRFLRLYRDNPLVRRFTVRDGILTTPAVPYRSGRQTGRHWREYDVSAPGMYRIVVVSDYSDEDYARFVHGHPAGNPLHTCWGLTESAPMARALRGRFAAAVEFEVAP